MVFRGYTFSDVFMKRDGMRRVFASSGRALPRSCCCTMERVSSYCVYRTKAWSIQLPLLPHPTCTTAVQSTGVFQILAD